VGANFQRQGEAESGGQSSSAFEAEPTIAGQQCLVPGVRPIGMAERLAFRAEAPLAPTKPQRALNFGLFDLNARLQLELFAKPKSAQGGEGRAEREEPVAALRPIPRS
jgi:hypothetical protein